MAARDLLERCGYELERGGATRWLNMLGVPEGERVLIGRSNIIDYDGRTHFPNRGLIFLTRAGRNHVLMASTKPEAKEFRVEAIRVFTAWHRGELIPATPEAGLTGPV